MFFLSSRGRNGTELLCCSNDGTVAYLDFQLEEIGTPLAKEDVVSVFKDFIYHIYSYKWPRSIAVQES